MKKVKTLLSIFFCIMATALFGACSCTAPSISVVGIKITELSSNAIYEEGANRYLVRQGETFTITYEIMPDNASDNTTYIETNTSKIITDKSIINSNKAINTIEFTASNVNSGESIIQFKTKDGGKEVKVVVEVLSDSEIVKYPTPNNINYNSSNNTFTWDKSTVLTSSGLKEAGSYVVTINGTEYTSETNSLEYKLESGVEYYVRAKAVGDLSQRTGDSELCNDVRFYVANTPANLKANDGVLTWEYGNDGDINMFVVEFDSYKVALSKGTKEFETRQFNLAKHIADADMTDLSQFNLKLSAVNTDYVDGKVNDNGIMNHVISSRNNPSLTLTQLTAPSGLDFDTELGAGDIYVSSMLRWNSIPNASYLITILKAGQEVAKFTTMDNKVNLSEIESVQDSYLSTTAGNYTLTITPKGDSKTTFARTDATSSVDFVVAPFLYGDVNYSTNSINLNTASLKDLLGVDDLEDKVTYELYYSTNPVTGYFDKVKKNLPATSSIDLSTLLTMSNPYYVLVRPVTTADYTDKNVVLPIVGEISNNMTVNSTITQLKPVIVNSVDVDGVLTAVDNNSSGVDAYKIVINGEVYSTIASNLVSKNEHGLFTISVKEMISGANEYTIQIIPTSTSKIDANPSTSSSGLNSSLLCNVFNFKQLGAVDLGSLTVVNNVVSWDEVSGADHYKVIINGEEFTSNVNSFEVPEEKIEDENIIKIQAIGDGTSSISGQLVSTPEASPILRASQVSGFKVIDGELIWSDTASSNYVISITYPAGDVKEIETNEASFNGASEIETTATITVSRYLDNKFNSPSSEVVTLTKLATPASDLAVINHTTSAQFSEIANASNYKLTFYDSESEVAGNVTLEVGTNATSAEGKINFTLPALGVGKYTVIVQACPSDQLSGTTFYIPSEVSSVNNVEYYPSVVEGSKTGTLSWTFAGDNVENYVIEFVGKHNPSTGDYDSVSYEDVVTTSTSYGFSEIASGKYVIKISAVSSEANVVYNAPTTITIEKTSTPDIGYLDGKIVFNAVSTASEYKVYNVDGSPLSESDYTMTTEGASISITPLNLVVDREYSIYIVAVGAENVLDGDASETVSFRLSSSVNNFTFNKETKVFAWENIENNNGYIVNITDKDDNVVITYTCSSGVNTYTLSSELLSSEEFVAGQYNIKVVTIGKLVGGVNYVNSNPASQQFTKLDVVSNMQYSNDVISWTYAGYGTPNEYKVEFLLKTVVTEEGTGAEKITWVKAEDKTVIVPYKSDSVTLDLTTLDIDVDYKIVITSIGSDASFAIDSTAEYFKYEYTTSSGTSTQDIFTRIECSSFQFNNGQLSVGEVAGAGSYEIYMRTGSEGSYNYEKIDSALEGLVVKLPFTGREYTLVIKTIASEQSGKLNSLYSAPIVIERLTKITDFSIDDKGVITWSPIFKATDTSGDGNIAEEEKTYIPTLYMISIFDQSGLDTGKSHIINSSSASSIEFSTIYESAGLEKGMSYKLAITAIGGEVDGHNYVTNEMSDMISINTVGLVNNLTVDNGVLEWEPVEGVNEYCIEVKDSYGKIKTYVVSGTSFNANSLTFNGNMTASIRPYSTSSSSYVVVSDEGGVNSTDITLGKYDCIDSISVENGLIKIGIDITGISSNDLKDLLSTTDYSSLDSSIKDRYKGYYTFKLSITSDKIDTVNSGVYPKVITLKDMSYDSSSTAITQAISSKRFYATYELKDIIVTTTTKLIVSISSVGNTGNSTSSYNYVCSDASVMEVYKHSAPIPTASPNLITSNGEISFKKVNGVSKYVLYAYNLTDSMECIIDTSTDQLDSATYNVGNVSNLTFTGTRTSIESGKNYSYYLTTLGTVSGNSGNLYLRSNSYSSASITFLKAPSLEYKFSSDDMLGGHLYWNDVKTNVGYRLYALPSSAWDSYDDSAKANKRWFSDDNVYIAQFNISQFIYYFENGGFVKNSRLKAVGGDFSKVTLEDLPAGDYWVAVQSVGDGINTITHATEGYVLNISKVSTSINGELKDGTFYWTNSDAGKFLGFRISVNVYDKTTYALKNTITYNSLINNLDDSKYSYTLDENISGINLTTGETGIYNLLGNNETYSISIIALGRKYNEVSYVNSSFTYIVNYAKDDAGNDIPTGFPRLDKLVLTVDDAISYLKWEKQNNNIKEFKLYIGAIDSGANLSTATSLSFTDSVFADAKEYIINLQAMAKGKNTYLNSVISDSVTIVKFYKPLLTSSSGKLVWDNENNGDANRSVNTEIKIWLSDKDGYKYDQVDSDVYNHLDATSASYNADYSLDLYELPGDKFYKIQAKFLSSSANTTDEDPNNDVYYISSDAVEYHTYKFATPAVETVKNFDNDDEESKWDDEKVASCIRWELVKDKTGALCYSYKIVIEYQIGIDEEGNPIFDEYKSDEGYYKTSPIIINNINSSSDANNDSSYIMKDIRGVKYGYFNTTFLSNQDEITGEVRLLVQALDNNNTQINSTQHITTINYSKTAPNCVFDNDHGIITWTDPTDTPMYVSLEYYERDYDADGSPKTDENGNIIYKNDLITKNYYLSTSYYSVYGKTFYLPFMAKYALVSLQYISSDQSSVSTASTAVMGDPMLFTNGEGTADNPYLITDSSQFVNLNYRPHAHIKVVASEITLSNWQMFNSFSGVLDGNNATFNVMLTNVASGGENFVGIFNTLQASAVVKNLKIVYGTTIGSSVTAINTTLNIGGIAYTNNGTIDNVSISGAITAYGTRNTYYGGVAVINNGTISNVNTQLVANINVKTTDTTYSVYSAGITYRNNGIINSVVNEGTIDLAVVNSSASNEKDKYLNTTRTRYAGGISCQNNGVIINSDFTGTLVAYSMAGITNFNTYSSTTFTLEKNSVVSTFNGGTILGCSQDGTFTLPGAHIDSQNNVVQSEKSIYIAGIAGENSGGYIGRCYAVLDDNFNFDGLLGGSGRTLEVFIGGIVAFNNTKSGNNPTIENSVTEVTGTYTRNSTMNIGAIIGYNSVSDSEFISAGYGIINCYYVSNYDPIYNVNVDRVSTVTKLNNISEVASNIDTLNATNKGDTLYSHVRVYVYDDKLKLTNI